MILASITVIQCEDCTKSMVLHHQSDYEAFEATWHDGLRYQFCPTCRHRPHAEDRIAEDNAMIEQLKEAGKSRAVDYAN